MGKGQPSTRGKGKGGRGAGPTASGLLVSNAPSRNLRTADSEKNNDVGAASGSAAQQPPKGANFFHFQPKITKHS